MWRVASGSVIEWRGDARNDKDEVLSRYKAAVSAMAVQLLEEFTSKLVISSDSEEGGVIS